MPELKSYIQRVFLVALIVFLLNRFIIRPWVVENSAFKPLIIVVNSIPNFIEAIFGTVIIAGMLFVIRYRLGKRLGEFPEGAIYFLAVFLAGVYVISQEVGFHNLGGNNVTDPNDVTASIIGLLFTFLMLIRFGLIK